MQQLTEETALAQHGGRVTRHRLATETTDRYGRPVRRIAERLTIEARPLIWNIHPGQKPQQYYLPRQESLAAAIARALGLGAWRLILGFVSMVFLFISLIASSVIGYQLSGQTGAGALWGIGAWALGLMLWSLLPRR